MLQQVWVFGGVERRTRRCFFEIVADRREATLLEIIKRHIRPGTTIVSDMHRSYFNLGHHGFNHLTVNHSLNFVDQETGANTQMIEALWGVLKRFLRGLGRNLGPHLEEYISEFLYRRKYDKRVFEQILVDIAKYNPPRE